MRLLFVVFLCLASAPALGQSGPLNRLDDWSEARGWEGVGLLRIANRATCTGALIRPDLVLTAAHCMYDEQGRKVAPNLIEFRAAWRDGQAISLRTGSHAMTHPDYVMGEHPTGDQVYRDLALLQLDMPVAAATAPSYPTGSAPRDGADISVVSYGRGRNDAASLERDCRVKADFGGVIALSCSVVPGSSGSPVFAIRNGQPVIVSVISALGDDGTAYGMALDDHIAALLADFANGTGVYPATVQSRRQIGPNTGTGPGTLRIGASQPGGGARFVKP